MTQRLIDNFHDVFARIARWKVEVAPSAETPFDAPSLDPHLDPRIEEIIKELRIAIPKMKASVDEAWAEALGESPSMLHLRELNHRYKTHARLRGKVGKSIKIDHVPLDGVPLDGARLNTAQNCVSISDDWGYPQKTLNLIPGELFLAWHQYLDKKNPELAALNHNIEARFNEWYDEHFDPSPELELRKDFLHRLKKDNQLGETLMDWKKHVDKPDSPYASKDRISKEELFIKLNRIFGESYCKPLGLSTYCKIIFCKTTAKHPRTLGTYSSMDCAIRMKVPTTYGHLRPFDPERKDKGSLADAWGHNPASVILTFLEERMHQFQDQVGEAYMKGRIPEDSPWIKFARGVLPQFHNTPGQQFVAKGKYYMFNVVERHVEGFLRDTFDVLYQLTHQAQEAVELIRQQPKAPVNIALKTALSELTRDSRKSHMRPTENLELRARKQSHDIAIPVEFYRKPLQNG